MQPLPHGWERRCLESALTGAGLVATYHDTKHGLATLRYGPDDATCVQLAACVAPGTLRIACEGLAPGEPDDATLARANDVCIDWNWGRVGYDPATRSFSALASMFAYPDHVPAPEQVRWACHALWDLREGLGALRTPYTDFGDVSPGQIGVVLAQFTAQGLPPEPRPDGSYAGRFDTGDDGSIGVRLSFEGGTLVLDALPLACPPWPATPAAMLATASLNHRLMAGAVTRWGEQLVIRQRVPLPFVPTHPQWAKTMLDAASWAAIDVVRLARGGTLERPN